MELKVFEEYADDLKSFQEWIKTQPSLPQNISNFDAFCILVLNCIETLIIRKSNKIVPHT